ncbi:MAG: hypothetical protein L0332_10540 [Chloroflexi bacterium]|nr:hypothetical protein [Chloroflexota bacterium]MCI0647893.1 hypothetical protein [Chloroflexota bacterium]MCI0727144.1 hypothetical protein [Chloroflexota bacterium]
MKNQLTLRHLLLLSLVALTLLACGLFTDEVAEQPPEDEAVTGGAVLGDVVTAEGVGSGNTPIGVTDRFDASNDVIYVVAEAEFIPAGTTLFARWLRDGEPFEDSTAITADRDYENTYVEFHLESLSGRMDEGEYSVQLFVNGNPVRTVEFTVE